MLRPLATACCLVCAVLPALLPALRAAEVDPFPTASPAQVGMHAAALDELAGVVQQLVRDDEIVGAELLVIKDDRTVLHRAFGWQDRDAQIPMEPDTLFCVRSMTKPVAGTAAQMLIESGAIARDDAVARHLACFDRDATRAITIQHLLNHTSGLPLSNLLDRPLDELRTLADVAAWSAEAGPEFAPGLRWSYSDDGTDVLGAVVEHAAGMPLERFLRERLFEPLGMQDTLTFVTPEAARHKRIASNHAGARGAWTRYWKPGDASLFPIFLASQGLYATPRDYARFLALWQHGGRFGEQRLLEAATVRHALTPMVAAGMPTGFAGVEKHWGEMWTLWVEVGGAGASKSQREVLAFGHGGSDGTFAYVFPGLDLMVLYFTQSRNNRTFATFERAMQRHLLDPLRGRTGAQPASYEAAELDAIAGVYWDHEAGRALSVLHRPDGLALEFPGRAIVRMIPRAQADAFDLELVAGKWVEVERAADGGVVALLGHDGDQVKRHRRAEPSADLPSVDDVLATRARTIDLPRVEALTLRIASRFDMRRWATPAPRARSCRVPRAACSP